MSLQALIFGCDGVLAETHELRREAYNEVFGEADLDWHWTRELYGELLRTTGGEEVIAAYAASHLTRWRPRDLSTMVAAMERRHAALVRERILDRRVSVRPGIVPFLAWLVEENMEFVVATGECSADVSALIECNFPRTIAEHCKVVSTRSREGRMLNAHRKAVHQFSRPARHCLAVESSSRGLQSAMHAAVPVLLTWGIYPQLKECGDILGAQGGGRPAVASTAILSRWDCAAPADLLEHLREIHELHCRVSRHGVGNTDPDAFQTKELDYAGVGHTEA